MRNRKTLFLTKYDQRIDSLTSHEEIIFKELQKLCVLIAECMTLKASMQEYKIYMIFSRAIFGTLRNFFRATFKFGRRVHFALRRKMRKPPITLEPPIKKD